MVSTGYSGVVFLERQCTPQGLAWSGLALRAAGCLRRIVGGLAVVVAGLPQVAVGSTPTMSQVLDLQGRWEQYYTPEIEQVPTVDEGLLIWDRDDDDGMLPFEVYDWIDGELVGPFDVIGGDQEAAVHWADRDGDRLAISRLALPGGVDFYTWSDVDQAFLHGDPSATPDDEAA